MFLNLGKKSSILLLRFKTGLDFGGIDPLNKLIAIASSAALSPAQRPLRFD